MLLAIPLVLELLPVELKVEAALEWFKSISESSMLLREFL